MWFPFTPLAFAILLSLTLFVWLDYREDMRTGITNTSVGSGIMCMFFLIGWIWLCLTMLGHILLWVFA